ncbi:HNH endonuclease [Paraburkholderia domus]|uniref:HNH endonuclease n=1 Tax=Paraburkholderia domus TaxID=2793075 RepID=UPI0019130CEB|nr:HNH endonuclease [Paraburkholderia domus]MBK5063439.1 HNH endonuclease [Burkholderia sp. R-70199]CAE6916975.1 hypothetical protein R70199_04659 [Paraburkholderia domus]
MARADLVVEVCGLIGNTTVATAPGDGWPGVVTTTLPDGQIRQIALHVSTVSPHNRKEWEFRFQNPGDRSPVAALGGAIPILLGLWKEDGHPTLLIATDGTSRIGREARFSVLFDTRVAAQARTTGWAVYQSGNGEKIYAFLPSMFPIFVAVLVNGLEAPDLGSTIDDAISSAAIASGLIDEENDASATRVRRAAAVLVRHYAFSRKVLSAYGHRCAMCGLGQGLVVGAHINPVAAEGAPDAVWNGLALCHNHHAAFDAHHIWVDPETRNIVFNEEVARGHEENPALCAFLDTTFPVLAEPALPEQSPRRSMLEARYEFFAGRYDWL